ncbi:MAG: uroporphyrinogen decarboxylase, partial [Arenicella sp.]|nr:uroporphyrinogen decarboxylase [Arenicella sp.]
VQGNLDPGVLLGDASQVREAVHAILEANGQRPGHVFNLGHGLLPQTSLENLQVLKDAVHQHAIQPS